jgi:hypothetical protein
MNWQGTTPVSVPGRRVFEEAVPYCLGSAADQIRLSYIDGVPRVSAVLPRAGLADAFGRLDCAARQAARVVGSRAEPLYQGGEDPRHGVSPDGDFREIGTGLVVMSPAATAVLETIDAWTTSLDVFAQANRLTVPALVDLEWLDRSHYSWSFPQHLTACAIPGPTLEDLEAFAARDERGTSFTLAPVAAVPALCYNVYPYAAQEEFTDKQLFTVRGACSRHEPSGFRPGRRQWSFTMREFVHIGSPEATSGFAADALDALIEAVKAIGLPARVTEAHDPFFATHAPGMAAVQSSTHGKYEVVGLLPDGSALALSSVNRHREHFSQTYGLRSAAGSPVHTACVGFGLERWTYWLLSYLPADDVPGLQQRLMPATGRHQPERPAAC